jgi:hypothetical protein
MTSQRHELDCLHVVATWDVNETQVVIQTWLYQLHIVELCCFQECTVYATILHHPSLVTLSPPWPLAIAYAKLHVLYDVCNG